MDKLNLLPLHRAQDEHYKDIVRVIKYWRDLRQWRDKSVCPSSYLLELLFLDYYQNFYYKSVVHDTGREASFNLFVRFLQHLSMLLHSSQQSIIYFDSQTPSNLIPWQELRKQAKNLIVVDPGNPTNNVANRMASWGDFIAFLRYSLEKFV